MNIAIKANGDQLNSVEYWKNDLLYVIAKKYNAAKCEEFCVWTITNISEGTKKYLRIAGLQNKDAIPRIYQVTYDDLLTETMVKYESLLGYDEWTLFVPKKQDNSKPYLPEAYKAAIEKAVSSSIARFLSNKGGGDKTIKSSKQTKSKKQHKSGK
eukprot:3398332-Ditylum_brightwellii.AAC.1